MEFFVLGPLEVRSGRTSLTVAPAQARLLALLLCSPNRWVRADALADALWGTPGGGAARLQVLVCRLRKSLGTADRIQHDRGSYSVHVAFEEFDVHRFFALRRAGTDALTGGRPDEAAERLHEAVGLWRGDPFAGLDDDLPLVAAEAARLRSDRLAALEDLYDAEIQRGSAADVVTELSSLAAAHPLRERLTALLALGLDQCGRRTEALHVYHRARDRLVEELGVEPSPELRQAFATILAESDHQAGQPAHLSRT